MEPSIDLLLEENNLKTYYNIVGDSIKEFVNILVSKIDECSYLVSWPFSYTKYFGKVLHLIVKGKCGGITPAWAGKS